MFLDGDQSRWGEGNSVFHYLKYCEILALLASLHDLLPLMTYKFLFMLPLWRTPKYGWLCTLLEWTNTTRHDLITRKLWPKPETTNSQELNTMPMHDKQWGTYSNLLNTTKNTAKVKPWPDSSTKQTVKLLLLPQPSLRARTDARTNPSAQRATQLRSVLARVYAVSRQNQITNNVP
jgi:hypothetical protein